MKKKHLFSVALVGLVLINLSCGDDDPVCPSVSDSSQANVYTQQGWVLFESGSFDSARVMFEDALGEDPEFADAHNGLGWSILFLGLPPSNEPLDAAITAFQQAIENELFAADPQVGLAITYEVEGNYSSAIDYAQDALELEPSYTFRHRQSIDYRDIHLVLAQSYFGLGEAYFPQAQDEVDILDPDNGLDPEDPTTWHVDLDGDDQIDAGETFGSYTEALMELIELLQEDIFG